MFGSQESGLVSVRAVLEAPIQAAIVFCFNLGKLVRERKLGEIAFGAESEGPALLYKETERDR